MGPRLLTFLAFFLGVLLFFGFFLKTDSSAEALLGKIPVQSGGRVKPFESFAQEALLSMGPKRTFEGKPATWVIWDWISNPEVWHTKNFLERGKISPEFVLGDPSFQEKVRQALEQQKKKEPLPFVEKKRIELYEQARLFQAIAQGSLPGFLPHPEDPQAGWIPLEGLALSEGRRVLETQYSPLLLARLELALSVLVQAFRQKDEANLQASAQKFAHSLEALFESRGIPLEANKLNAELFYNRLRPFRWAWIFYLASGLAWFFLRGRFLGIPSGFFFSGFTFHTLGFFLRCFIAGRPPVTNMYESVIWVAWAVVLFSILLRVFYKHETLPAVAAWVAALTLLLGESFPTVLDPSLSPLVPVLRNNYWLTVHVLTITLSYGAFALAWGLAHLALSLFAFRPEKKEEQENLSAYLYRALQIGVVLLAAGTILGGVWANASWGRFWGWDPKETWALIALFGYLIVLHGRSASWLGPFGTALGSVLAFLGILMAWYGVNFVLAAGFHSYGFGGGGLPYVLAAVFLDLLFVTVLAFRYNKLRLAQTFYGR